MVLLYYPKCGTCKKAIKWLEENNVKVELRNIVEDKPTEKELEGWSKLTGLPVKKFFNTCGQLYRELQLKDKIPAMNDHEQYKVLANDGMLVKRPLLVSNDFVLVGFKQEEWAKVLLK